MRRWLASMLRWFRRSPRAGIDIELKPATGTAAPGPGAWLATALDRAMTTGDWTRAEQIIGSADRLARSSPDLAGAIARCRLVLSRPDEAVLALDDALVETEALARLRVVALFTGGRSADARRHLKALLRRTRTPRGTDLLGLVTGDDVHVTDRVIAALESLPPVNLDPMALAAITARIAEGDDPERADRWSRRLADALVGSIAAPASDPAADVIARIRPADDETGRKAA